MSDRDITPLDARELAALLVPEDRKALQVVDRYRLEGVTSAATPAFEEAFGALSGEFATRGEIERRDVVERWLSGKARCELPWRYHLLRARDEAGALAGARDCHVTLDVARRLCVVYLAHTLVLPAHRRSGLATLFRRAPLLLGRRMAEEHGLDPAETDILLAAEMEPYDRSAPETGVRLVAYGRGGFAAVSPRALPYCQPDFREPDVIAAGGGARPLPLLAVVRRPGHEREGALPRSVAEAFVTHLYAVFATHCDPAQLARPRAHALQALAEAETEAPLLPLPISVEDEIRLTPLSRDAVLPFHLPEVRSA